MDRLEDIHLDHIMRLAGWQVLAAIAGSSISCKVAKGNKDAIREIRYEVSCPANGVKITGAWITLAISSSQWACG